LPVYDSTCAVCHGANGSPDPDSPVVQGLGVTPADLSDPLFNSREPSADWEMVVKHGGHAMGLAEQMPAHKDALSDEQVADVMAYIKSIVDTSAYPPGEMNLFLPVRTKKAFPEDEIVYHGKVTNRDGENAYKNVLEIEKRVGRAGQIILELVHKKDAVVNELAEVELGYKQALSWSKTHILSGAVVYAIPVNSTKTEATVRWNWQVLSTTCIRHGHATCFRHLKWWPRNRLTRAMATLNGRPCHRYELD
jgi:cytochrome c553